MRTKTIIQLTIGLVTLFGCYLNKNDSQSIAKIKYYLGTNLPGISDAYIFENSPPEYDYPRNIYISFTCKDPKSVVGKLNLIPSDPHLNRDSSRKGDYILSKYNTNFWKMRSTIMNRTIEDIEKNKLEWWKPDTCASAITYGGFYNEFYKNRIVNGKKPSTGRLIFQFHKTRVFIQIDLMDGK